MSPKNKHAVREANRKNPSHEGPRAGVGRTGVAFIPGDVFVINCPAGSPASEVPFWRAAVESYYDTTQANNRIWITTANMRMLIVAVLGEKLLLSVPGYGFLWTLAHQMVHRDHITVIRHEAP